MPKFTGRSIQSKRNQRKLQNFKSGRLVIPSRTERKKNVSERLVGGGGSHSSSNFGKKDIELSSCELNELCEGSSWASEDSSVLDFGSSVPSPPLTPSSSSSYEVPLSPKHSRSLSYVDMTISTHKMLDKVRMMPVLERCDKLADIVSKTSQETFHYKQKSKLQQQEMQKLEEECVRKVAAVRYFWRDKIFNESSRSGKIVKKACNGR